tara:strand:- start:101 stop:421 length:321 start_codon:yes stop_codon:yes gene_type:complete
VSAPSAAGLAVASTKVRNREHLAGATHNTSGFDEIPAVCSPEACAVNNLQSVELLAVQSVRSLFGLMEPYGPNQIDAIFLGSSMNEMNTDAEIAGCFFCARLCPIY